jgi:hypothetical protein
MGAKINFLIFRKPSFRKSQHRQDIQDRTGNWRRWGPHAVETDENGTGTIESINS